MFLAKEIMDKVRDAIILAGGRGTRMLPANLFMAKETLPLIDTPILNHIFCEAALAGVERIHLVLSKQKEEQLRSFFEGESNIDADVRADLPRIALDIRELGVEIRTYIQEMPGGVGDAIAVASKEIEGAFLVLLGDNILIKEHLGPKSNDRLNASGASLEMVKNFEENGLPCVGIKSVSKKEISKYGVVEIDGSRILKIVEKPKISDAPSSFVLCGRYLLTSDINEILDLYPESEFGEMQSIEVLGHYIKTVGLESVKFDEYQMYDSGGPISWLKAQIDHGLRRDDISSELYEWLTDRLSRI